MREGITTTESFKKEEKIAPQTQPIEFAKIPLEKYNELLHVQKSFSTNFKRLDEIVKNMENEVKELKELVENCKEKSYKYLRF